MVVLGLCGGSGSGKGEVCLIMSEVGIPAVDTDLVYRAITSSKSACLDALVEEFGDILDAEGKLDRKKLAAIVFAPGAEKQLAALNRISHRYILDEVRVWLRHQEEQGIAVAVVDAPLLFESGFNSECDAVIGVVADKQSRIGRIVSRDGIGKEAAEGRIRSQIPDSELVKLCDYIIENNGSREALRSEVLSVVDQILKNRGCRNE